MAAVPRGTFGPVGGGRAAPKPPKPKPPRIVRPKPIDPNVQANQNAMSAFRTALAQLNATTAPVDSAAIIAPYRASEQVAGQLGQGLQQAELNSGQAAQSQYGQALGQAQQQASMFGVSAGAGANTTALPNAGAAPLAAQTNAYAAAAPQAATQWQQLLERAAAAKVSDATIARNQGLTTARQSLAGNIPQAIQNEEQLGFQQQTQRENIGLAMSQLDAKDRQFAQQYGLDALKARTSAATAATGAGIKRDALNEKTWADQEKIKVSKDTLALKKRAAAVSAAGLVGIPKAVAALTASATKPGKAAGTQKVAKGWDVQVVALDPDTGEPTGTAQTMTVPDKRFAPKGFQIVKGASAKTHYETVPTRAGPTGALGVTRAAWDAQMRSLLAQNQGVPGAAAQIKRLLGPRPKK